MSDERFNSLKITGVTVTWDVENIWKLSFDGVSSTSFMLSDHIFHLYMRRYELSIAIYLCRDDAIPIVMQLLCKVSMVDYIGKEKLIGEREVTVDKEKEFVLLQSVMISDLESQKEEFLAKDIFTISCSLSSSYRLNIQKQQEPETEQLIQRFETLSSDLESFYKAEKHTDALLRTDDKTEFQIHRTILCARCPKLASMFNPESPEKAVDIPNLSAPLLQDVLFYIYTGKIRALSSRNVIQMLAAANRLSLLELREICLKFMGSSLTEDNVFEASVIAYEYDDPLLKEEVEQYLVKHVSTILPSKRWKEFCSERYKFANEILTATLLRMQTSPNEKEQKN